MLKKYADMYTMKKIFDKFAAAEGLSGVDKLKVVKLLKEVQAEMDDFDKARMAVVEEHMTENGLDEEAFRAQLEEMLMAEFELSSELPDIEVVINIPEITPSEIMLYELFLEE